MLLDMPRLARVDRQALSAATGHARRSCGASSTRSSRTSKGQVLLSLIIGTSAGLGHVAARRHRARAGRATRTRCCSALFVAFTELIPYLGPWLGAMPPFFYALAVHPVSAIWVALLFLFIHQVEGHVVVPNVMGSALRLHPLLVIFGLLAGGEIYGLPGIFVALPLLAVVRAVWEFFGERIELERWADRRSAAASRSRSSGSPGRCRARLAAAKPLLAAHRVSRRFGARVALEPTDVELRPGETPRPDRPERRREVDAARDPRRRARAELRRGRVACACRLGAAARGALPPPVRAREPGAVRATRRRRRRRCPARRVCASRRRRRVVAVGREQAAPQRRDRTARVAAGAVAGRADRIARSRSARAAVGGRPGAPGAGRRRLLRHAAARGARRAPTACSSCATGGSSREARRALILAKDLRVLKRSPLLLGVLLAYPLVIALLVGLRRGLLQLEAARRARRSGPPAAGPGGRGTDVPRRRDDRRA